MKTSHFTYSCLVMFLLGAMVTLTLTTGCAKAPPNTPPAPPPPGTLNCQVVGQVICTFDHETNVTLQAISHFVGKFVADNNAGKFTLTASQKGLLNQVVDDVNLADATYQAWHNAGGTGPTAPVTLALNKAQNDQALLGAIPGGK